MTRYYRGCLIIMNYHQTFVKSKFMQGCLHPIPSMAAPRNFGWINSLLSRVFDHNELSSNLCKKQIYARLSTPNSIDGGTKKVWLDKGTGKACLLISSNVLAITGIYDRRYWSWISTEESSHIVCSLPNITVAAVKRWDSKETW